MSRGYGEAVNRPTELPTSAWYLLQCKPRQDARAQEHLDRQGFECFAPTLTRETIRAGKLRQLQQPLFPGYVLIRMSPDARWLALRSGRGVSPVVACGRPRCRVRESSIDPLKLRCAAVTHGPVLMPGDRVQIKVGEFADMEALFLSMDGQ